MKSFRNMEMYIDYVAVEVQEGRMPKIFGDWYQMKVQSETLTKHYAKSRWSENTQSWVGFLIEANTEHQANEIADRRLIAFETQHALDRGPGGRVLTVQERHTKLRQEVEKEMERDSAAKARQASKREALLKKMQQELGMQ